MLHNITLKINNYYETCRINIETIYRPLCWIDFMDTIIVNI